MTAAETAAEAIRGSLRRRDLAMTRHHAAVGRALSLDETELRALLHLQRRGPMTASRLAVHMELSSGGITHLVQRLHRAGHVVREPHPQDRRSRLLALAPGLEPRLPELLEPAARLEAIVQALDERQRSVILTFVAWLAEQSELATEVPALDAAPARATPVRSVPSCWG